MDSEGFFGPGVAESYDAKVFTIATLLGGHLVYNTVKIIDQQAVNLLEMLARRAQLFRTRTSKEQANLETPEFLSVRSFPPLTLGSCYHKDSCLFEVAMNSRGASSKLLLLLHLLLLFL